MCNPLIAFSRSVLKAARVESKIHTFPFQLDENFDCGLRKTIYNTGEEYDNFFQKLSQNLRTACETYTLFQFTDRFGCEYIFLNLPDTEPASVLIIGPFSYTPFTNNYIFHLCHQINLPESHWDFMQQYYFSLPVINEKHGLDSLVFTLARELWGDELLSMPHLTNPSDSAPPFTASIESPTTQSLTYMEQKYESEDSLMKFISDGDLESIEQIQQHLNLSEIKQRFPNSLRDQKNNLLIFNTICRKAAQYGGVHPIYLDTQTNKYTARIEYAANLKELNNLYREIPHKYCLLVHGYSLKDYSPTIRKIIMYISFHLTEDLGLQAIAEHFSLNKNYLSAMFKKETGVSLTTYVNQKRVRNAIYLLNTTSLPVQNIAETCGINDLNYFSRIFRQQVGMSPSSYRRELKQNKKA